MRERACEIGITTFLVLYFLFGFYKTCRAEEIITINLGVNNIPNNIMAANGYECHINKIGHISSFLVPINFKYIKSHVKVEKIFHNVEKVYYRRLLPYVFTFTSWNTELLFGTELSFHKTVFIPQISIGRADETIYSNSYVPSIGREYGAADRDHYYHLGISIMMRRNFEKISPGLVFQIQKGVHDVHAKDPNSSIKIKAGLTFTLNKGFLNFL